MEDVNSQTISRTAVMPDAERSTELSIENLYDSYAHSMFRYALALTGSADDAEDAVQDVFIRIDCNIKHLSKVSNIKSYLLSATRNASYSLLRRKKRRDEMDQLVFIDIKVRSEEKTENKAAASSILREAFSKLLVEQREVVILKIYDEMTFKEISETTGVSINTVASRYRYAIERLRQVLEGINNG